MPVADRPAVRGLKAGRRICFELGEELRRGREAAGLGQKDVGKAIGVSYSLIGRLERAVDPIDLVRMAQALAVVGLDLNARAYPHGSPIRDRAQAALLERFRTRLPEQADWRLEVPLPNPGDLRSWDAMIRIGRTRIGVEAETRVRDGQALLRRLALKRRDGGVDRMILVMSDTRGNREAVRLFESELRAAFPVPGRVGLARLATGQDPGGDFLILC
jgi:transcriptional regulator with XRE-family HTH domain